MKNIALITGASSGIGAALARVHAEHGGDLILVARRQERLEQLKAELERAHPVTVQIFVKDLTRLNAARDVHRFVHGRNLHVEYLINNAGFGGFGPFHERDWDHDRRMIQLNVVTLTALTRLFLPEMLERRSGKILNVASLAGFVPGPLQSVYYASKAYVLSFSEALANELLGSGVTVTAFCPGATHSEFAKVAALNRARAVRGKLPTAAAVAQAGYRAMLRGRPVAVPGFANQLLAHVLLRFLPRGLVTKLSRARMERD